MALPQVVFLGVNIIQFTVDFATFYALYLSISLTLNLEFGSTGIPNFGKVLYVAGGAAVAGTISGRLAAFIYGINTHNDFITFNSQIIVQVNQLLVSDPVFVVEMVLLSLVIAAIIGGAFGYLSSYPAINLREDYLGMLLLAVGNFFQIFLRAWSPLVGGTQGILVPAPFAYFASLGPGYRDLAAAVVMGVFCVAVYVYAERVVRSPLGRMLKAVRDNEDAARALGKNDVAVRRNILIVASALSGMAGALVTFYSGAVGADTWTRYAWTFWPWLIVIIGGASNNVGVALGAFFFAALNQGLNQIRPALQPYIPFDANWLTYLIFGGLLIVMLLVRPQGIVPEKPTPTLPRGALSSMAGAIGPAQSAEPASSRGGTPVRQLKRAVALLRRPPGSTG
jgi:branched-chain amino acid transport system permease protein